ncbi:hypothetical protein FB381_4002 [Nocardioides albertanoniae]|uniref:Uncharacterized protein n=1 Tax=Nocardioides albertanoniae TaxID=1175486 RepID=A0A543AC67_9ACTN|nr:hypothetical protein [Nocardioides albertanoniae]TQL70076.1 hypothetical protein FB381_4002 [Nocardioides albertanoniae]
MRSHELAWAVGLLECVPQVEVTELEALDGHVDVQGVSVAVVDVRVTVADAASAQVLAESLILPEWLCPGVDLVVEDRRLRIWQGWVPEGSHEVPVSIEVATWEPASMPALTSGLPAFEAVSA